MDQPAGSSLSEIDKALASLSEPVISVDIVPDGWKPMTEWASLLNLSRCRVWEKLRSKLKTGEWESRVFRVATPGRGHYPTPHYRKKPD